MQSVIGQADFAAALFDPGGLPVGTTTARGQADAVRFGVYRNNVMVALTQALKQRFPVVLRLVGEDFFQTLAKDFVRAEKPRSPLIFQYGDSFADFIDAYAGAASVPYLGDVARVEAAWTDAYHAADAGVLSVGDLAAIHPGDLLSLTLRPHPAAALILSPHPAGSIWSANQQAHVQPVASWQPEAVLVTRPALEVGVHILPKQDRDFASALFNGSTLGEAAEGAGGDFDFGAALVGLVSLGAFQQTPIDGEVA